MEKLAQTKHHSVEYSAENKTIYIYWTKETETMSADLYKKYMLEYVGFAEDKKIFRLFVDLSHFLFVISPEMQEWVDSTVFVRGFAAGVRRVALVVSSDLISQLSVEQAMETEHGDIFTTHYFDEVEEAKTWLLAE